MKRTILVLGGILACLAVYWVWSSTVASQQRNMQSSPPRVPPSKPVAVPLPPAPAVAAVTASEETVEFPSIGKVKVTAREQAMTWKDAEGKTYSLPFKFQYAENGVWVRAFYRGPGVDYPEDSPKNLEKLYAGVGDKVVGLPPKSPSAPLVQEIVTNAHQWVDFTKASKVVIEHLVLDYSPDKPPEPALMIKIWGVEKAWADSPDSIPRVRLTYYLISGVSAKDDAL